MIVLPLTEGQDPGRSSDKKYETVTRNYDEQEDGEPYITAEFANDKNRAEFPVGDEKFYSRDGITEARRKRRATSELTVRCMFYTTVGLLLSKQFFLLLLRGVITLFTIKLKYSDINGRRDSTHLKAGFFVISAIGATATEQSSLILTAPGFHLMVTIAAIIGNWL